MGSLEEQLTRQRERSAAKRPPEVSAIVEAGLAYVRSSGVVERALHEGARAPDFTLPNVRGEEIRLGDLLGRTAVVLAFYRGSW
jgi:hypothetical protein